MHLKALSKGGHTQWVVTFHLQLQFTHAHSPIFECILSHCMMCHYLIDSFFYIFQLLPSNFESIHIFVYSRLEEHWLDKLRGSRYCIWQAHYHHHLFTFSTHLYRLKKIIWNSLICLFLILKVLPKHARVSLLVQYIFIFSFKVRNLSYELHQCELLDYITICWNHVNRQELLLRNVKF